jgi:indolepyruvate ferredoxin oxidoreductase
MAFGEWMLNGAFPTLSKLKVLRGTPLDPFGYTAERKMERGLIREYEAAVERLLAGMTDKRLPIAVRIAAVPQEIRGYGFIKDKAVEEAKAAEEKLWRQWEAA